jgi:hypothetical protein
MKNIIFAMFLLTCGSLACKADDEVVVNERFSKQTRDTQNPPHSLAWYASHEGVASNRGRNLRLLNRTADARQVTAHFPRLNLAVGDLMTFEFEFDLGAPPSDDNAGFRFGLFDSGGEKRNMFSVDGKDPSVSSTGYAGLMNLHNSRGGASVAVHKREGRNSLLNEKRQLHKEILPRALLSERVFPHRRYHVEMVLARLNEAELTISFELSGGGMPASFVYETVTSDNPVFAYDTIGFSISGPGVSDVYLYDIVITREKQSAGR